MKFLDVPQSGHLGTFISFKTNHGQARRPYVIPRNPRSPHQMAVRAVLAEVAARWRGLTEIRRRAWTDDGAEVPSNGRLGDHGTLSGSQFHTKININLAHVGEPWMDDPPARPQFGDNPVGEFRPGNTGGIITLQLVVAAPPTCHILLFATAPASRGTSVPRRFALLGLLPAPVAGLSAFTSLYLDRFGAPPPNTRIFIRTVQQINGWRDLPSQTDAVVPL